MTKKMRAWDAFGKKSKNNLAERSKTLASGASPQGRGFEPHSYHVRIALGGGRRSGFYLLARKAVYAALVYQTASLILVKSVNLVKWAILVKYKKCKHT